MYAAFVDRPVLKQQEVPFDSPESINLFQPAPNKPFVATPTTIGEYSQEVILDCLRVLQGVAEEHQGADYLQVFDDPNKSEALWIIENSESITGLLPSEY